MIDDGMLQQQEELQQPLQIQEEPQQLQDRPLNLEDHLAVHLRNWELQPGQTLAEARMAQKDQLFTDYRKGLDWLKQAQRDLSSVVANKTAEGAPQQEQPPQKFKSKKLRKNAANRRKAQEHHPEADEITYELVTALTQRRTAINHSLETVGGIEALREHGYDERVLLDLCQGYQKNQNGDPASEEDARKMREDRQFLLDYDSGDIQRRKPHLDRIVDDIIHIQVHEWMFDMPYVLEHTAELRTMAQKILLIENLMADNQAYFEQLRVEAPVKYGFLRAQECMGPGIGAKMGQALQTRCVNMNNDTYLDRDDSPQNYMMLHEAAPQFFAEARANQQNTLNQAFQAQIDRHIQESQLRIAAEREQILNQNGALAEKLRKAGLTADYKPDSATTVLKYHDMILSHRDRYLPHQEVVDKAYEQLFQTIDIKDDLMVQVQCTQEYAENYDPNALGYQELLKYAPERIGELQKTILELSTLIASFENLLKHILRDDPLEPIGTVAAMELEYHQPDQSQPRTEQDQMLNTQYRNIVVDEQGKEQVTFYTKEDQNITLAADSIETETVHYEEQTMQNGEKITEKKTADVEFAQSSAQYSSTYKTQAAAIGRMLWMETPPHSNELAYAHAQLSALASKMYEPIEVKGRTKMDQLENAGDQIMELRGEITEAIHRCEAYVKLKFGFGKKKKAAKRLVEETLKLLRQDAERLEQQVGNLMYRAAGGDITFGELLGDARATVIDLNRDRKKLGRTGANMSDVITVGEGPEKLFFKEEEPLVSTADVFQQKFLSTAKDRKKYGKLLPLFKDSQNLLLRQQVAHPELRMVSGLMGKLIMGYAEAAEKNRFDAEDETTRMLIGDSAAELAKFGLPIQTLTALLREIAPELKKTVVAFENLTSCAEVSVGNRIAVRNVATSRMASILGISDVVVRSNTAIVQETGKQQRRGIVMARAQGQPAADLELARQQVKDKAAAELAQAEEKAWIALETAKNTPGADLVKAEQVFQEALRDAELAERTAINRAKVTYTPDAVRQLSNLHLLDLVCGQTDRHLNNYFVTRNQQGQIDGIQGIDNDVSFGELTGKDIMTKNSQLLGLKMMNLPVVDKDVYDLLRSLTSEVIQVNFADLLSQKEIHALIDRIQAVRGYLSERKDAGTLETAEKGQWTADHAARFARGYEGYVKRDYL